MQGCAGELSPATRRRRKAIPEVELRILRKFSPKWRECESMLARPVYQPPALDDDLERGMDLGMFLAEMKNVKAERDQLKAEAEQLSETSMSQESMIEQLTARCDELESARAEIEVAIPKGCGCLNVEMGSYDNQVELKTPEFILELGAVGCLSFRETTCVDACVAPLVLALWERGVVTTGACCGHNQQDGYVGIYRPTLSKPAGSEQAPPLEIPSRTIKLSGCELTEADLLESAVRAVRGNRRNTLPRWALVRDAFCVGSGVGTALCRRFGFDPEEILKS